MTTTKIGDRKKKLQALTSMIVAAGVIAILCAYNANHSDYFHLRLWEESYRYAVQALSANDSDLAASYLQGSKKYATEANDPFCLALSDRQLAMIAMDSDHFAECESLIQQAIKLLSKDMSRCGDPLKLETLQQQLATCYLDRSRNFARQGQWSEAAAACQKAIDLSQSCWDKTKDESSGIVAFDALSLMANIQARLGNKKDSLSYAQRSLLMRNDVFVDEQTLNEVRMLRTVLAAQESDHTYANDTSDGSTTTDLITWARLKEQGEAARNRREFTRAESLYVQALNLARSSGRRDLRLTETLLDLYQLSRDCGRLDQAESYGKEAIALYKELLVTSGQAVADINRQVGQVQQMQRKFDEAAEMFSQSGSIRESLTVPEQINAAWDEYENAADSAISAGHLANVAGYLSSMERIAAKDTAGSSEDRRRLYCGMGKFYCRLKLFTDAERCFRKTLQVEGALTEMDKVFTLKDACSGILKIPGADLSMPAVREDQTLVHNCISELINQHAPDLGFVVTDLGASYCATGDFAKALPVYELAQTLSKKRPLLTKQILSRIEQIKQRTGGAAK